MTCDQLRQDYTSYALGIAEDPERSEIAGHLARNCPECISGMASAMATVTAISGAVPIKDPPKDLRKRIMATVRKAPRRSRAAVFLPWAITAAMSIALVAIGVSGRRQIGDTARLQRALSILNDPATRDVSFGETEKPSKGRVFVSPKGVVLIAAGLPRIDTNRTFELWLIPAKGNPVPSGLFQSLPDATAVFVRLGPIDPGLTGKGAAVAVTVEPEGGSKQPTTTPFIVTKL
ncbi:MAG TPA: anti-sigma factor [Bryobacteraceae bacterium]|jgi:anti-sigma-K factor RskA|nr:anti-sigma factor [Bryobacteraceae bacterium]